ncbi:MAG: PH domain-containing protein [Muribaculaceae bacterium]|nr:PH domain-containing protein [Muribaculaceae bacterium]
MEKKTVLSLYSKLMSILAVAILVALLVYEIKFHQYWRLVILGVALVAIIVTIGIYAPRAIAVKDDHIIVKRFLTPKMIPLKDVESVQLISPTMAERRLLGSGGWMGYWGWFKDGEVGRYFAYYGKASECFLVKLKSGRQYMLGCKDTQEMVDYIQSQLNK